MVEQRRSFARPSRVERVFNRVVGALVSIGIGFPDMRVLEVRGRKSGKRYSLPVDLLAREGRLYLVAPRGDTQWARNAAASGEVTLRTGGQVAQYRLRALSDAEKPAILKAYLDRFHREVQRFFPLPAGAPMEAFVPLTPRYPVFELLPCV